MRPRGKKDATKTNQGLTFRSALRTVRLHRDMRIEMVERAVGFLATVVSALVHALDLFVPPARSLVLLSTRDRNERIHLLPKCQRYNSEAQLCPVRTCPGRGGPAVAGEPAVEPGAPGELYGIP